MADPRTPYQRGRILAAIATEALTAQQLADRLHLTKEAINIHLKAMKEAAPRLIHVSGHQTNVGGRPAPKYSPGQGVDAAYVRTRAPKCDRKAVVDKTFQRVLDLLESEPRTANDLGAALDLAPARARWYLNKLRTSHPKQVYIKRYERNVANYPSPVYAAGSQKDTTYKPKSRKTIYREAMRDPDRRKRILSRYKLRNMIEGMRKKPNGIFGALGI